MKRLFILLIILFFHANFTAQVITIPEFPTENDSITIIYNATLSSSDVLVGYTGDLYTHTGVQCSDHGNWQHVIESWGNNNTQPKLTRIGTDLYQLVIGKPHEFYNIPANDKIEQLNFVFRSSDANTQSEDIFIPLYNKGLNVKITEPNEDPKIYNIGDTFNISVASLNADTTKVYLNNELLALTTTNALQYSEKITSAFSGTIRAVAIKGSESIEDTLFVLARVENNQATLPEGIIYGINYTSQTSVTLALHAPNKDFVFVIGDFNDWKLSNDYQLNVSPDHSVWWIEVNNLEPGVEYAFQYLVDGKLRIADPYAEKVLDPWNDGYISEETYPNLKEYPFGKTEKIVSVLQTNQSNYNWEIENFVKPPKEKLVIYELLVRDFVQTHNYNTLVDTLDYLERLGVTAIELMPVNEFEGNSSWGYNPSFYFAPDKYYGKKETLQRFVDECHKRGIAVIMDIVLNHAFGQCPFVELYFDKYENGEIVSKYGSPWFNVKSPNRAFYWGADFNHESIHTQRLIDRINNHWLNEYKFDGFRFDFTKGMTNKPGDGQAYDASRISILKRMADLIWENHPDTYIILEHLADNSEEKELSDYGIMLWGNMNHSYNEGTMGYNESGKSNFSEISYKQRGWNDSHLVGYMESHDEERLMFKNLKYGNSNGSYDISNLNVALQRVKMASTFFYTIPGPKMLWMFGELGYDYSINTCDDGSISDACRLSEKPVRWDYQEVETRNNLYKTISALTYLKQNYETFSTDDFSLNVSGTIKRIKLNHESMNITIIGNFGVITGSASPNFQTTGTWYDYFTGDSIMVTDSLVSIELEAGEFHLYSDKKLPTPDRDIILDVQKENNLIISDYKLMQNYPNPFNPTTTISYQIPGNSFVQLKVFDMLGREVASLVNSEKNRGVHNIKLDASKLSSGMYIYQIKAGSFFSSKKMLLLK